MNALVPHPTTAIRCPGRGSRSLTSDARSAARDHMSGWLAISAVTKAAGVGWSIKA